MLSWWFLNHQKRRVDFGGGGHRGICPRVYLRLFDWLSAVIDSGESTFNTKISPSATLKTECEVSVWSIVFCQDSPSVTCMLRSSENSQQHQQHDISIFANKCKHVFTHLLSPALSLLCLWAQCTVNLLVNKIQQAFRKVFFYIDPSAVLLI